MCRGSLFGHHFVSRAWKQPLVSWLMSEVLFSDQWGYKSQQQDQQPKGSWCVSREGLTQLWGDWAENSKFFNHFYHEILAWHLASGFNLFFFLGLCVALPFRRPASHTPMVRGISLNEKEKEIPICWERNLHRSSLLVCQRLSLSKVPWEKHHYYHLINKWTES